MQSEITSNQLLLPDALTSAMTPATSGKSILTPELKNLATSAVSLFQHDYPSFPFRHDRGFVRQMEDILETEADHSRKRALIALINSFRAYFNLYDPDKPHENDGQVIALTSKDMLTASLIVTSPRGIGNMPTLNTVQSILDKAGITCGVDTAAIEQALQEIRRQKDIIWCLPIANGEPAQPASLGRLAFNVPLLDKEKMAENVADISTWLIPLWPPLEEGAIVATLTDSTPSSPGRSSPSAGTCSCRRPWTTWTASTRSWRASSGSR